MIIFPLKWLPWILFFGGLFMLIGGEGNFFSVLLMLAGGVWIYYSFKNKKTAK